MCYICTTVTKEALVKPEYFWNIYREATDDHKRVMLEAVKKMPEDLQQQLAMDALRNS